MTSSLTWSRLLLSLSLAGCAASQGAESPQLARAGAPQAAAAAASQTPPANPSAAPSPQPFELAGYWVGTTTAFCNLNPAEFDMRCNSINVITLSLFESNHRMSGFYQCSFGNQDCRNQNVSGKVAAAKMRGRRLEMRIAMPDLSSCIFEGAAQSPATMRGTYFCYQGGGLMEQGRFEIRRRL